MGLFIYLFIYLRGTVCLNVPVLELYSLRMQMQKCNIHEAEPELDGCWGPGGLKGTPGKGKRAREEGI